MTKTLAAGIYWLVSLFASAVAFAQEPYPARPVSIVVPFAAGGAGDQLARAMGQHLARAWGQPVIVENKPGASGIIATQNVINSGRDGYTFLLHNTGLIQTLHLTKEPGYDPFTQLTPVVQIGTQPIAIAVSPQSRLTDIGDVLENVRNGSITSYGTWGNGSTGHVFGERLRALQQSGMDHITYRGESTMLPDLIADRLAFAWISGATALARHHDRSLRVVATTGESRINGLQEVPTLSESGLAGFENQGWWGIFAPAGSPDPALARMHADVSAMLQNPEFLAVLNRQAITPSTKTPDQFRQAIKDDNDWWRNVIQQYGIKNQ